MAAVIGHVDSPSATDADGQDFVQTAASSELTASLSTAKTVLAPTKNIAKALLFNNFINRSPNREKMLSQQAQCQLRYKLGTEQG